MRLNALYFSIVHHFKYAAIVFVALIIASLLILFFTLPQMPQFANYHHFADARTLIGIPNFWNVISNIPFLLVSILGFMALRKGWSVGHFNGKEAIVFLVLFLGVFLVGIGSAYYHLSPDNSRLVWDRIPMTVVFMALLSFTFMERVHFNLGFWLLAPLVLFGVFSVVYWYQTELTGQGDIRLYALAQFYSIFLILLTLVLFPKPYPPFKIYLWMFVFYALAKVTEHFDLVIYEANGCISGHTLKHVFAAISIYFAVVFVNMKSSCAPCNCPE